MQDGSEVVQRDISSGMFNTLMLLSYLILSPPSTVLLIDELENGLGFNCLADIISEIKSVNFQCIISTHHPKVISDMATEHWKVVNRKGNRVIVNPATAVLQSTSHHDHFIQLLNSASYNQSADLKPN